MTADNFPDLFGPNKASHFIDLAAELRYDRPGYIYHPQLDEGYSAQFLIDRAAEIIGQLQGQLNALEAEPRQRLGIGHWGGA